MEAPGILLKNILVIDAQGGGIGKQLIISIKKEFPESHITAVGTNFAATSAMKKAGADSCATGENSVIVACRSARVIVCPIGAVIADSMTGEISPAMARAVAQSGALRILIPFDGCGNVVVGTKGHSTAELISEAVQALKDACRN